MFEVLTFNSPVSEFAEAKASAVPLAISALPDTLEDDETNVCGLLAVSASVSVRVVPGVVPTANVTVVEVLTVAASITDGPIPVANAKIAAIAALDEYISRFPLRHWHDKHQ